MNSPQSRILTRAAVAHRRPCWRVAIPRQPRGRRSVPHVLATSVLAVVAGIYELTPAQITAPGRQPLCVEARRICAQLLYEYGAAPCEIGRVVARDHSTVLHALAVLETRMSPEEWDMLCDARRLVRAELARAACAAATARTRRGVA